MYLYLYLYIYIYKIYLYIHIYENVNVNVYLSIYLYLYMNTHIYNTFTMAVAAPWFFPPWIFLCGWARRRGRSQRQSLRKPFPSFCATGPCAWRNCARRPHVRPPRGPRRIAGGCRARTASAARAWRQRPRAALQTAPPTTLRQTSTGKKTRRHPLHGDTRGFLFFFLLRWWWWWWWWW